MVGNARPLESLDDADALAAASAVIAHYEGSAAITPARFALNRVVSGTKQVVAGMLWSLNLELQQVACSTPPTSAPPLRVSDACPAVADVPPVLVSARVFSQPWKSLMQVTITEPPTDL